MLRELNVVSRVIIAIAIFAVLVQMLGSPLPPQAWGAISIIGFLSFAWDYLGIGRNPNSRKRIKQLGVVAEKLGGQFKERHPSHGLSDFRIVADAKEAKRQNIYNHLTVERDGATVVVFDFSYAYVSEEFRDSESVKTHVQTVVHVSAKELRLPRFRLQPESLWQKIRIAFGRQDIDFENHYRFSSMYQLEGDSERKVRKLFNNK